MIEKPWIRKPGGETFRYESKGEGIPLLTSPLLSGVPGIRHGFTTREGGVSEGIFSTLNLSFRLENDRDRTFENFRRVAAAFDLTPDRIVLSDQVHDDRIRIVTREDAGKGVTRPKDYEGIDGLVTNEPGLLLIVLAADCVPILLTDPVRRVIGAVHSGWRGTAVRIGETAMRLMSERFGSDPKDVFAAIGPSICQDCFEVSEDVAEKFREKYDASLMNELIRLGRVAERGEQKYHVNLQRACMENFLEAGLKKQNISLPDICTACNKDYLFSHRASFGKRGNQAAVLMLR